MFLASYISMFFKSECPVSMECYNNFLTLWHNCVVFLHLLQEIYLSHLDYIYHMDFKQLPILNLMFNFFIKYLINHMAMVLCSLDPLTSFRLSRGEDG